MLIPLNTQSLTIRTSTKKVNLSSKKAKVQWNLPWMTSIWREERQSSTCSLTSSQVINWMVHTLASSTKMSHCRGEIPWNTWIILRRCSDWQKEHFNIPLKKELKTLLWDLEEHTAKVLNPDQHSIQQFRIWAMKNPEEHLEIHHLWEPFNPQDMSITDHLASKSTALLFNSDKKQKSSIPLFRSLARVLLSRLPLTAHTW